MVNDTRAFLTQGFRSRVSNSMAHTYCVQVRPEHIRSVVCGKGGPFLETRNSVTGEVVTREKMEV